MKTKRFWIMGSVLVVLAMLLGILGCAGGTTQTTTTQTTTQTTQTTTQTTQTTTQTTTIQTTAAGEKTIKIGLCIWLGWSVGLDMMHSVQVAVDMDNAAGGLLIGGERYKVQLIYYDNKSDQAASAAAINRLIFVDGVKYILSDPWFYDSYDPVTEANKVILLTQASTTTILSPDRHYSFDGAVTYASSAVGFGWLKNHFPDKKTFADVFMDNQSGHSSAQVYATICGVFGWQIVDTEFYPADTTDFSSLGLKVAKINPDVSSTAAGGVGNSALYLKALWQAGYNGPRFTPVWAPTSTYAALAPAAALEGLINGAWPTEFDPPTTAMATAFKNAWIAKYGKWEAPEIQGETDYEIVRAALMQAGSTDVDKVAAVISSGLKWEGPQGPGEMAARPDLGQSRTVCAIVSYPFKITHDGKPQVLDTISLDNAAKYFGQVFHN